MIDQLTKYAAKLAEAGLCAPGEPLLAAWDAELCFSHAGDARQPLAEAVLHGLGASALLLAEPTGACQGAMLALARQAREAGESAIIPGDCETRTFLHDLPVVDVDTAPVWPVDAPGSRAPGAAANPLDDLASPLANPLDNPLTTALTKALMRRKGCLILRQGRVLMAAVGSVSPEQTFVTASSMAFACFVAYFARHLAAARAGRLTAARRDEFAHIRALLQADLAHLPSTAPQLSPGPFANADQARAAMIQAGRAVVEYGLVDSSFGNVSCRQNTLEGELLLISQTGSALDELSGLIDPCRMDGSSCVGLTASSEYPAHKAIYDGGPARAILHGHPRFAVILSLDCDKADCPGRGNCHRSCAMPRSVRVPAMPTWDMPACDGAAGDTATGDTAPPLLIPIVPGEVGAGPYGLCNTLPPALNGDGGRRGAIVYGHGLFATGREDFREAFATLHGVERFCREEYFRRVAQLDKQSGAG